MINLLKSIDCRKDACRARKAEMANELFNIVNMDGVNYIINTNKDGFKKRISLPCDDDDKLIDRLNMYREMYIKDQMIAEGYGEDKDKENTVQQV